MVHGYAPKLNASDLPCAATSNYLGRPTYLRHTAEIEAVTNHGDDIGGPGDGSVLNALFQSIRVGDYSDAPVRCN